MYQKLRTFLSSARFTSNPIAQLRVYSELSDFRHGSEVEANGLIDKFYMSQRKLPITIDKKGYAIAKDTSRGYYHEWGKKFPDLFYDSPFAFVLTYNDPALEDTDKGIACTSFEIDGKHAIRITQLQGKLGKKYALLPIRWEKMFVRLVEEWATKMGAKELRISTAESNFWRLSIRSENGQRRYDTTAEEMGFKRSGEFYSANLPLPD
ncbi:MAG: hypothetical protein AABX14_03570 [Candidatus Aenigmatarchaeota archaeon]